MCQVIKNATDVALQTNYGAQLTEVESLKKMVYMRTGVASSRDLKVLPPIFQALALFQDYAGR